MQHGVLKRLSNTFKNLNNPKLLSGTVHIVAFFFFLKLSIIYCSNQQLAADTELGLNVTCVVPFYMKLLKRCMCFVVYLVVPFC